MMMLSSGLQSFFAAFLRAFRHASAMFFGVGNGWSLGWS